MRISILMPCYNAGEYLYKSIKSIQDSTIQDLEIICVNDGSTDNTLEILRELQDKDDRIKIITRPEKGYANTMNEALDEARGDYILNVDPDDWISPLMLERMLSEVDGCDFVKCGFWFEFKDSRERYLYEAPEETFCPRRLPPEQKMKFFASQIAIWSCMIRRSFLDHIRLNETPGAAYQDTYFVWQINALADRVKVIQEPLYHYNKTNDNASTASSRYPLAPAVEYRRMADWCMDNPKYGIYVRQVLCRCRFGSYMWNMSRIDKEDRLAFAKMAQEDFNEDYNYIDARMFTEPEYDVFLTAMKDPAALVEMFDNIEKGVKK